MKRPNEEVFNRLSILLSRAYAPYSKFRVASAILDEGGQLHFGVNVENQSFSVATCAEAGAISAMHVAGGKKIRRIYLLSQPNIGVVPCGACRQRLVELCEPSADVVTFDANGNETRYDISSLLPNSFRFTVQENGDGSSNDFR